MVSGHRTRWSMFTSNNTQWRLTAIQKKRKELSISRGTVVCLWLFYWRYSLYFSVSCDVPLVSDCTMTAHSKYIQLWGVLVSFIYKNKTKNLQKCFKKKKKTLSLPLWNGCLVTAVQPLCPSNHRRLWTRESARGEAADETESCPTVSLHRMKKKKVHFLHPGAWFFEVETTPGTLREEAFWIMSCIKEGRNCLCESQTTPAISSRAFTFFRGLWCFLIIKSVWRLCFN